MHIANFDPATAEGGFPVTLQDIQLTRRVSGQFFGLEELKAEVAAAPIMEVAKQPKVLGLMAGALGIGLLGGWMLGRRQMGM